MRHRIPTCVALEYGAAEPPHWVRCTRRELSGLGNTEDATGRGNVIRSIAWVAAGAGLAYAAAKVARKDAKTAAIGGGSLALLFELVR